MAVQSHCTEEHHHPYKYHFLHLFHLFLQLKLLPQNLICIQIISFSTAKLAIYHLRAKIIMLKIYKNATLMSLFDKNQPIKVAFWQ